VGFLGKWVKYNQFLILAYASFVSSPTDQARRRIFTLDGSNDVDSYKNVPFGGFFDIALHLLHLGGEPPNTIFGA